MPALKHTRPRAICERNENQHESSRTTRARQTSALRGIFGADGGAGEALVRVLAASLKPIDKQLAAGSHYASPRELPVVCGADGVGELADGRRVFFGGPRRPYGAMAERTVVPAGFCFPVPKEMDDATAAALPNPGLSALLSLNNRAAKGQTVLILGATGITGTIAVQIAKLLGAGRVIGAGRNPEALEKLRRSSPCRNHAQ